MNEQLNYPEVKRECNAIKTYFIIVHAMINAHKSSGITQKELSQKFGIAQGDISKLENGNANPSLRTLQRLASTMEKTLKIEFV